MSPSDISFLGGNPANVVGMLLHEVAVEVVEGATHLIRMFLIDTENNRLAKAVGLFQKRCQVTGDGLRAGA